VELVFERFAGVGCGCRTGLVLEGGIRFFLAGALYAGAVATGVLCNWLFPGG